MLAAHDRTCSSDQSVWALGRGDAEGTPFGAWLPDNASTDQASPLGV